MEEGMAIQPAHRTRRCRTGALRPSAILLRAGPLSAPFTIYGPTDTYLSKMRLANGGGIHLREERGDLYTEHLDKRSTRAVLLDGYEGHGQEKARDSHLSLRRLRLP